MRSHVVFKVRQLFESPAALVAFVRLLTRVRVSMYFHVHFFMESFATKLADERLVVGVCLQVIVQVGCAGEGLAALGTRVRLETGVSQFMTSQVSKLTK